MGQLFPAGPGNGWLLGFWPCRWQSPRPRGAKANGFFADGDRLLRTAGLHTCWREYGAKGRHGRSGSKANGFFADGDHLLRTAGLHTCWREYWAKGRHGRSGSKACGFFAGGDHLLRTNWPKPYHNDLF